MVIGLAMIKVGSDQEKMVYARLQKRPEVKDVFRLFGEYSFFLVIQAKGRDDLSRMLGEIEEAESVVKAAPILLTRDHADWERMQAATATA
jgi:DNA-binding Lrp family transcriptional regulator